MDPKKNEKAERKALSALEKRTEADKAMAEHREREAAINKNTARLRALRLAHEAANPPQPKTSQTSKPAKKKIGLTEYMKRENDSGRKT